MEENKKYRRYAGLDEEGNAVFEESDKPFESPIESAIQDGLAKVALEKAKLQRNNLAQRGESIDVESGVKSVDRNGVTYDLPPVDERVRGVALYSKNEPKEPEIER